MTTATDSSCDRLIDPQSQVFALLVCYTALVSTCLPTFRTNVWGLIFKQGQILCPETSVENLQLTPHQITEERRKYRGVCLNSRTIHRSLARCISAQLVLLIWRLEQT